MALRFLKPAISFLQCTILIFLSIPAFSQKQAEKDSIKSTINSYVLKYDTVVSIKLSVNAEYDYFEVNGDNFYYDIRPNINLWNKLSVSYKYLTLRIGFKPAFLAGNGNSDLKGETKSFSIGVQGFSKHWFQELHYFKIAGFYLKNTGDYIPDWTEGTDPYIQFPELSIKMLRGVTGYKFNPNFSLRALTMQTQKQLKSTGSFIATLNYDFFNIDNQVKNSNTTQRTGQSSKNFILNGSLGYMYTFVIGSDFYTSLGVLPGGGFQHVNLKTYTPEGEIDIKNTDPVFSMIEKAAVGYNHNRFYTGAEISLSQAWHKQNKTTVQTKASRTYFQVFLGYRFNAPRFLKKETDTIKSNAPELIQKNLN
jgi:hypothetical protein